MEEISMEFEQLKDRAINTVQVCLTTESGCDASEGEYSLSLTSFIGALDLSSIGGVDDISLIKDCIENDIGFDLLPEEGNTIITLQESGEWEDVFWNKYYKVLRVEMYPL